VGLVAACAVAGNLKAPPMSAGVGAADSVDYADSVLLAAAAAEATMHIHAQSSVLSLQASSVRL